MFRSPHLLAELYPRLVRHAIGRYPSQARTPAERRRRSARTSRQLRMLRAHGLIKKVAKTHRYQLTDLGRLAITALLAARQADTTKLTAAA